MSTPVNPNSLRQRLLALVPYDEPCSGASIVDALGLTERKPRVVALRTFNDLVEDGYIDAKGKMRRDRGRPVNMYQRRRERRVRPPKPDDQKRFEAARRLVESAGWVLVPRRALP